MLVWIFELCSHSGTHLRLCYVEGSIACGQVIENRHWPELSDLRLLPH